MKIGRNMRRALEFAREHPGWHSYNKDRPTKEAIRRLEKQGLIEVNEHEQFRAIENRNSNPAR